MKVEIITIGDEILIGQIVDTNSAWMAQKLNAIGANVSRIVTITDTLDDIKSALADAEKRADVVLITGGLGPTKDDVTKIALAEHYNCGFTLHEPIVEHIKKLFATFGKEITELNRQQANLPSACEPLQNDNGTAPGMWFDSDDTIVVSMPGVPYEMKGIMSEHVLPRLKKQFNLPPIVHRTVLTTGMGESWLSERIEDWESELPENVKLAYLPSPGRVRLRLSASGDEKDRLRKQIDDQVDKLLELIPELVYGYDNDTLEEVVGRLLLEKDASVGTAESCTGGNIAHRITSVPGSSKYFLGSVVSYANDVKINQLGVKDSDLAVHGAVSEPVIRQMAEGLRNLLKVDYAVATSGIAGPDGGTEEKPVGTVWISVATPKVTVSKKFQFGVNRARNIHVSSTAALNMLRKQLTR